MNSYFLIAQTKPSSPSNAAPQKPGIDMIIPILVFIGIFYFLMIRPQRNQQKKLNQLRDGLKVGDKIISTGGIHGIVSGITNDTVSVKVSDGVSIKLSKSSVASVASENKKNN